MNVPDPRRLPVQTCTCLFSPCQCERIAALTPEERITEQQVLTEQYWTRRAARLKQAEQQQIALCHVNPVGMDGVTREVRQSPPPLRHGSVDYQNARYAAARARVHTCAHCHVADTFTFIGSHPDRAPLHAECRRPYRAARRAAKALHAATLVQPPARPWRRAS
jgi:hypothetical protein